MLFYNGGHMETSSNKKFFKRTPFIVLFVSGLVVVASCAYYGFKLSGLGGGAFGAFIGLTICLC
jgi:hypothetical protein